MQPVHIIVNPAAAGGRGALRAQPFVIALERASIPTTVVRTTGPGDGARLAAEAARGGAAVVVAAGGDGTAHDVANGLLSSPAPRPALGLLPIGTGNDFARAIGAATSPDALLAAIRNEARRSVDAGIVRWDDQVEHFVNGMGLGIDVEVVREVLKLPRLPGVARYLVGLLRALRRYRPLAVEIETADGGTSARIMMLAVTNGHRIGGGFHICPDARPDDGRLDVCLVRELGPLGIARTIPRVLRGTHQGSPGVSLERTSAIRIRVIGARRFWFQLDGELRESTDAAMVEVEVMPNALQVLAAGGAA